MRWQEFYERLGVKNGLGWESFYDPDLVKELISDFVSGNMEFYELGNYLEAMNVTRENLYEYFNCVSLNSFDKNILRFLLEERNHTSLLTKYNNYSDKCYLYSNKARILLPIIKMELADMYVASKSEKTCLEYFEKNHYSIDEGQEKGFSLGNWDEDIQAFIDQWTRTIEYLESLLNITKSIIQYFEIQLKQDSKAIKEFFFENPLNFDFFLMLEIYETYIRHHDLDKQVADDIARFYKEKNIDVEQRIPLENKE